MTADEVLITCYNPGCQDKKYLASENTETACRFHPNMPIFHDGIKRWPCCKKSSCDFSTLLAYPGCIQGPHNPEKPKPPAVPPAKTEDENVNNDKDKTKDFNIAEQLMAAAIASPPPKPQETIPVERNPSEPLVQLKSTIMPSLKAALAKLTAAKATPQTDSGDAAKASNDPTQMMSCENFGCNMKITRQEMEDKNWDVIEDCLHHPMPPIFHEGLQYWSCCQKKHTDFEKMRNQPGCTYGKHRWTKGVTKVKCRYDHFDNPKLLTLNIYAKNCNPEQCSFEANSCRLRVRVVYGVDQQEFEKEFDLFGTIDPSKCCVNLNATKIEVKLAKEPFCTWKAIEVLPPPSN